ncbi:MAG: type IV secretion system protein TraC [Betaproteobacteria bacterium AqS2]|uniref:Type IV secretion system protein TraC n=1 Tax=Candidatus Amphirhobacter heronislandensis TaxID=1732024 RepID=A0A930UFX7_9GAMM|nr:type IV secretion system protein TraC [Betaproteobacteria bacterium AqS2]
MMDWLARPGGAHDYGSLWEAAAPPSFADVLPYGVFSAADMLFELPDGGNATALGFALECLPQTGSSEQIERSLQELPALLGPGTSLQATLYADPGVGRQLAAYCRSRPGPAAERGAGVFRRMARERFSHVESLADELRPCDFRLFISVTQAGSLGSAAAVAAAERTRQSVETLLAGCAIPARRVDGAALVNLAAGVLNPASPSRRAAAYDPAASIARQCLLRDTTIDVGRDAVAVSGDGRPHELMALHASRYPASLRLGGMLGLLGDPLRANLRYLGPFMITLCVHVVDQESMRALVALKQARAQANASSAMARLMPGYYRRQQQDWQVCSEVMDGGGAMVLMAHQALIQAPPGAMAVAEERARSVWRARGFSLARSEYLQLQGLLAALPLTLTPGSARDLRRLGMLALRTSHNASHGMPVIAEWKGTPSPALLLVGRRGQLMQLDIFDSKGNHNLVVAGSSGSGKSVLLNEIAASALGLGAKVWIFDVGRSYLHASEQFGGQALHFGRGTRASLNPFTAVADIDEDMRLLKPLFAQMIAPQGGLGDLQRARLELALKGAWAAKGRDAAVRDVHAELVRAGESDPRVADMAAMLAPYASGVHARWFNRPASLDLAADMIVFELEDLSSDPELQRVVMLQLLYFVTQEMYADRERRKLVVIDEAYELMRGENVAEFIEQGYRRARKYNGAFLAATQSVSDFYLNPAGRSAIANSDWLMLLRQKEEELRQLLDHGQLALSAAERELVGSLATKPGSYAEVFVRCEGVASGVGRLAVDRYAELLYSSRSADRTALARHRARGLSLEDSIRAVLKERDEAALG